METRFTIVLACALAGAALTSPAWAINKCAQPDGSVAFQDAPCTGKGETLTVRPASGRAKAIDPVIATEGEPAPKRKTEAQRIEEQVATSQQERRLKELVVRLVPDADAAIYRSRDQCSRDMKALQLKKQQANNNLAGATWEGSISGEMTALATSCDTRNRELREDAAALRAECRQLGGCK